MESSHAIFFGIVVFNVVHVQVNMYFTNVLFMCVCVCVYVTFIHNTILQKI